MRQQNKVRHILVLKLNNVVFRYLIVQLTSGIRLLVSLSTRTFTSPATLELVTLLFKDTTFVSQTCAHASGGKSQSTLRVSTREPTVNCPFLSPPSAQTLVRSCQALHRDMIYDDSPWSSCLARVVTDITCTDNAPSEGCCELTKFGGECFKIGV